MITKIPVSLVVPLAGSVYNIRKLLLAIAGGSAWPEELLVVASIDHCIHPGELQSLFVDLPLDFISCINFLMQSHRVYPGAARNIGVASARCEWISFLDVNTLPTNDWLEIIYAQADAISKPFVIGVTQYISRTRLQRIFLMATYGQKPLLTVPGSLVHRRALIEVGCFLPHIRAGEDTDWLIRVRQFGFDTSRQPVPVLMYEALPSTLSSLVAKWFRNYRSCSPVVFHLETQKTFYVVFVNLLVLLVSLNWNSLIADWESSNIFYVANITKFALAFIITSYFLFRGLAVPLRRGFLPKDLLPYRWLAVAVVCCIIDLVKLLAFVFPPWRDRGSLNP